MLSYHDARDTRDARNPRLLLPDPALLLMPRCARYDVVDAQREQRPVCAGKISRHPSLLMRDMSARRECARSRCPVYAARAMRDSACARRGDGAMRSARSDKSGAMNADAYECHDPSAATTTI